MAKPKTTASDIKSGLNLLVNILKRKRERRRISLNSLAKRAAVDVTAIEKLEAHDVNSVGLVDLLSISKALGSELTVQLAPIQPRLPQTNEEILREFDRLIKSRRANPFLRNQPDKKYKDIVWDVVGDKEKNWLFVVAGHRKKKRLRFGQVTDEPGGWRIAGQIFGIDAETEAIARRMSRRLFRAHRDELLGQRS